MVIVLFDTNILIDHFERHDVATAELLSYKDALISQTRCLGLDAWRPFFRRVSDAENAHCVCY
jgi:hypothetical protein